MKPQWMILTSAGMIGPVDEAELRERVAQGQITRETRIRPTTRPDWLIAGQVRGLFPAAAPTPGIQPVRPAAQSNAGPVRPAAAPAPQKPRPVSNAAQHPNHEPSARAVAAPLPAGLSSAAKIGMAAGLGGLGLVCLIVILVMTFASGGPEERLAETPGEPGTPENVPAEPVAQTPTDPTPPAATNPAPMPVSRPEPVPAQPPLARPSDSELARNSRVQNAIVEIQVNTPSGPQTVSGVLWAENDLILTVWHPFESAISATARFAAQGDIPIEGWVKRAPGEGLVLLYARSIPAAARGLKASANVPNVSSGLFAPKLGRQAGDFVNRSVNVTALLKGEAVRASLAGTPYARDVEELSESHPWLQVKPLGATTSSGDVLVDPSGDLVGVIDDRVSNPDAGIVAVSLVGLKTQLSLTPDDRLHPWRERTAAVPPRSTPQPPPMNPPIAAVGPGPAGQFPAMLEARDEAMSSIVDQWQSLLGNWEGDKLEAQPLEGELRQLTARRDQLQTSIAITSRNLQAALTELRQAEFQYNLNQDAVWQSRISSAQVRVSLLQNELGGYQSQLRSVVARGQSVENQLAPIYRRMEEHIASADRHMQTWWTLSDPFNYLGDKIHRDSVSRALGWTQSNPRLAGPYISLAFSRTSLRDFNLARNDLESAVSADPRMTNFAELASGFITGLEGSPRSGITAVGRARERGPFEWLAYLYLGILKIRNDDHLQGVADLKKAAAMAPQCPEAQEIYARALATSPLETARSTTQAIEYANKACELTKHQNWRCLLTKAEALAANGQFDEGRSEAEAALQYCPPAFIPQVKATLERITNREPYVPLDIQRFPFQ